MLQVALTAAACGSVLALSYFLIRGPILKYRENLKAEFALSQDKLNEAQELMRRFPNPQKASEEIEKKAEELKAIGATSRQIPRLIQLLALPASKLTVNIISIRPREDIQPHTENLPPVLNKVYIELLMSASYQNIAEYAKALSGLPNTFIIERLTMEKNEPNEHPVSANKSADNTAEKEDELSATILISTYTVLEI